MLNKSELVKRFGKSRLTDIAGELGLEIDPSTHGYVIVDAIREDLDDNGVPVEEELSEDLFDFMVAAEYITADGELIELEDEPTQTKEDDSKGDLPACWGYGDPEHDPACERCPRNKQCVKVRDKVKLPELTCFGELYNADDKNCQICVVWRLCSERM